MGYQWYVYFHPTYSSFHTKSRTSISLYLSLPINLASLIPHSFPFSTVSFITLGRPDCRLYLLFRIIIHRRIFFGFMSSSVSHSVNAFLLLPFYLFFPFFLSLLNAIQLSHPGASYLEKSHWRQSSVKRSY